ncbi:hypothetical protein [Leadbetterella sp. DM7]|uniref:hypothetical protein n=1 Tax=Leadbetterella sp. DM7 TaxID=3235085 RepID=UPI00349E63E1
MKIAKNIISGIFILSLILLLSTYWHKDTSEAFEGILTFLSIVSGFAITGMSIVATSTFSKELYKKEASDDNSKTLLHKLVDKFEYLVVVCLATICFILLHAFLTPYDIGGFKVSSICIFPKRLLSSIIWILTGVAILKFLHLIRVFSAFIIQSSKKL